MVTIRMEAQVETGRHERSTCRRVVKYLFFGHTRMKASNKIHSSVHSLLHLLSVYPIVHEDLFSGLGCDYIATCM